MKNLIQIKIAVAMLAGLSLLSQNVLGKEKQTTKTVTVTVVGVRTCKEWRQGRDSSKSLSNDFESRLSDLTNSAWLAGYASGLSVASSQDDIMRDLDLATLEDWTDRFCKRNVQSNVMEAIKALFKELDRYPY